MSSVRVSDVAVDVGTGLPTGCYVGQVRSVDVAVQALVSYGSIPPAEIEDWFVLSYGATFEFRAGSGAEPCWVRSGGPVGNANAEIVVARRRVV
ncbi:MAG: hypothetical protein OXQ26_12350 [bacterium]|nr:hypothetical protein [bacterium]